MKTFLLAVIAATLFYGVVGRPALEQLEAKKRASNVAIAACANPLIAKYMEPSLAVEVCELELDKTYFYNLDK